MTLADDEMERVLEGVAARIADGDIGGRELTGQDIALWQQRPTGHVAGYYKAACRVEKYPGELTPMPAVWRGRLERMAAKKRGEAVGSVWGDGMDVEATPGRKLRAIDVTAKADRPQVAVARTAKPRKPTGTAGRQMVLL